MRPRSLALRIAASAVLLACALPSGARAQGRVPTGFYDALVFRGLSFPTGMAFLPDGRLLVVEKDSANVRLVVPGSPVLAVPILHVDSVRTDFFEQGLLGVAVDPGWPQRPYVYVYYDALDSTVRIARFRASGNLDQATSPVLALDPASRYDVLRDIPDVNESHNGGTLRFGPDGMLYTALADDWDRCASQDTTTLRGVVLRLDVRGLPDGPGGPANKALLAPPDNPWSTNGNPNARLVWATGFRNPFRFHIDPQDGAIFVTDVGNGSYEEVDRVDAPGLDFGWPFYEGNLALTPTCSPAPGVVLTPPIHVDDRRFSTLAATISAGVYRGALCVDCNFPAEYQGDYFFADFYRGFLKRLKRSGSTWSVAPAVQGQPSPSYWGQNFIEVTDFLNGKDGALWYCRTSAYGQDNTGEIRRILYFVPTAASVGQPGRGLGFAPPSPSPAKERVSFSFTTDRAGDVDLAVFDLTGRRVAQLVGPGPLGAGAHVTGWNGRDPQGPVPSGVYFARLVMGDARLEQRFALVR